MRVFSEISIATKILTILTLWAEFFHKIYSRQFSETLYYSPMQTALDINGQTALDINGLKDSFFWSREAYLVLEGSP